MLNEILADIPANSHLGEHLAFLTRVALLAGDEDRAQACFTSLRARTGGEDIAADAALEGLVPLMVL